MCFREFRVQNGSSQGQNLALTGLIVASSILSVLFLSAGATDRAPDARALRIVGARGGCNPAASVLSIAAICECPAAVATSCAVTSPTPADKSAPLSHRGGGEGGAASGSQL